jgi:hypothetical protein
MAPERVSGDNETRVHLAPDIGPVGPVGAAAGEQGADYHASQRAEGGQ